MFKPGDRIRRILDSNTYFELVEENMQKSKVNFMILNDSVVVTYNGEYHTISSADKRYEKVLKCIKDKRLDDIPSEVEVEKRRLEAKGIELKDGLLMAGNEALPAELEERIAAYKEKGLPFDSLLLFWENLKKNPSYNSRQQLFKFLTNNGHPITSDGCFIAYRGVSRDFKDKHTGSFDNSPGQVCEMPRELVDDNPNNTCSKGLHVACFDYAKGFGEKLVEVKVNPMDVVAVPTDYNGTKMRTCRFEVVSECQGLIEGPYKHEEEEEIDTEICDTCDQLPEDCDCDEEEEECWIDCDLDEEVIDESDDAPDHYTNRHAKRGRNGRFVKA